MTVKEIVTKYLKDNGFDGLFSEAGECACEKDDLMPCGEYDSSCESGYKTKCDCEEEHNFHISREREKPEPNVGGRP